MAGSEIYEGAGGQARDRGFLGYSVRALAGASVWGVLMAASAGFVLLYQRDRAFIGEIPGLLGLFLAGGFIGYLPAFVGITWLRHRVSRLVLFFLSAILLSGFTLAGTAGVVALEYREYYSEWHAPFPTRIWFWEQAFTAAGSTFQFAVMGTRLYWPLGIVFLLATSWWLSRKQR